MQEFYTTLEEDICLTEPQALSRLLYPNPVCLLTSCDASNQRRNVMTISWLTCIDSKGTFFCSINKARHSVSILKSVKRFVLNVPVQGMEQLALGVGGCSGKTEDKFTKFKIPICQPGWRPLSDSVEDANLIAVASCVAHIECNIISMQEKCGHFLTTCKMKRGWVRPNYWDKKKRNFIPQSDNVPPYFTFFGSQTFGYVRPTPSNS